LFPTIDHVIPVSHEGTDDERNQVTTSMLLNAQKANFTVDELGWSLRPPGDPAEWDGLMGRFVAQVKSDPAVLADGYIRQWFAAARPP
jgi:hypothetical protein